MCGIAGYLGSEPVDEDKFNKMVDIISYRGPDDRGVYIDGNLALGHRRLSIFDLSLAGHQPYNYKDRYVVVYNGEIYNFIELKEKLKKKGYTFVSDTDTEVLIACFDCYGKECVSMFNGMWAFAIWDKQSKELFISRDRFGVKPLYYCDSEEGFLFASEIKQILTYSDKKWYVNKLRLIDYLVRGYSDYTEETMIEGIYQLRGGYNLTLNTVTKEKNYFQYYDLNKVVQNNQSFEKACAIFREAFENSVDLRLRADVPVGYCLSGGLDSSAIVCVADNKIKVQNKNIKQVSISSCFSDKRYDEQEYIDEVLNKTDVEGIKIFPDGNSLFDDLDDLIWHMDEPFGSTSMYAQWNVFKGAANNKLTVMIDGQGADEQLAGYSGFYSVILAEYLRKFRYIQFFRELKKYKKLRAETEKYVKSYKIIVEALISAYIPRKLQKLGKLYLFYLRQNYPFEREDIKRVIKTIDLYPASNSRQYILDQFRCNLSMLLRYEDRNSMAFSIESRVPFLDYKLVESAFSMPIEYKINGGITKLIMRESLKDILPEKIRTRYSKLGFVTPEDQWINDNKDFYREELRKASENLSPILSVDKVLSWYDAKKNGVERMDFMLFRIICAGRWIRVFNLGIKK